MHSGKLGGHFFGAHYDLFERKLSAGSLYCGLSHYKKPYSGRCSLERRLISSNINQRIHQATNQKSHIAYFILGVLLVASAYYFDDENFIKWKTSIILWAGALFILFRQLFSKKYIIQDLLKANNVLKDTAPQSLLAKINWLWIVYLTGFSFLNLYIAYTFSTDVWFWFKIIGLFVSTFLLFIISIIMLKEHVNLDDPQDSNPHNKDSQE